MATGRTPRDFRWEADGAATAPHPATKANFLRSTFWRHSAIWATRIAAPGRRASALGTQYDSRHLLRAIHSLTLTIEMQWLALP
jgi:hypothetical protein